MLSVKNWTVHHDPGRIDRALAYLWISSESYWAANIPRDIFEKSCDGSVCFGAICPDTGAQVGFARVITDGATFAYLCDVFVDPGRRGEGIGTALVRGVIDYMEPLHLRRWALATRDAHTLYEKFGFELSPEGSWMHRKFPNVYRGSR